MNMTTSNLLLAWVRIPQEIHKKLYEKTDLVNLYSYNDDFTAGYLAAMHLAHLCISDAVIDCTTYTTAETEGRR